MTTDPIALYRAAKADPKRKRRFAKAAAERAKFYADLNAKLDAALAEHNKGGRPPVKKGGGIRFNRTAKPKSAPKPKVPRTALETVHGTRAAYEDDKCRCAKCRKTQSDKKRAQYAKGRTVRPYTRKAA